MPTEPTTFRLPPAPRSMRCRPLGLLEILYLACFVGFALFAVVFNIYAGMIYVVEKRGEPILATVDGTDVSDDLHGTDYYVRFHYPFHGEMKEDRQQVSRAEYERAEAGDIVTGKAMRFSNWTICLAAVGDVTRAVRMKWAGSMGADLVVVVLAAIFIIRSGRERQLVRYGTATSGTILGRRYAGVKHPRHYVTFSFELEGTTYTREQRISSRAYSKAAGGRQVTVLFDEHKPARCIAYEFCPYEVRPGKSKRVGAI